MLAQHLRAVVDQSVRSMSTPVRESVAQDLHHNFTFHLSIQRVLIRNEEASQVRAAIGFYWFFCSVTGCVFSSSAFCQLALGLYSFIDLATTSVFLPRSF